MLDISVGLRELTNVREIHVVAVQNEVKELLWVLQRGHTGNPKIVTANINGAVIDTFDFHWNQECNAVLGAPERFLYEPNAALLKSGAFQILSEAYRVRKLHRHTHLYTSEALRDFPGRRFIIEQVVPYRKKEIKNALTFSQANVTTRNFPESVAALRKKWKLKDGGTHYLFFTTLLNDEKALLITSKI
ncbi:MAG: hypothetical protein CMC08_02150 [Flavobacteriaceae bacterium]|nr:hypothetical protein [Flavobacteriaceae bacterium]|tara:strand:+ start:106 stop:672 length:567 start_codon:yes stop_codon:yes gene_type:complete